MNTTQAPPLNILVLCTGNSARSIMAEALINVYGEGHLRAYSAGSKPVGRVNPFAIERISKIGYPVSALSSKSWNDFTGAKSPVMDIIITVCDNAANEVCPMWPGTPLKLHWGFADPAAISGSDMEKQQAFEQCCNLIQQKVEKLVALSLHKHTRSEHAALLKRLE